MASFTVEEIVRKLGGELSGDGSARISGYADLSAAGPSDAAFVVSPRTAPAGVKAGLLVTPRKLDLEVRAQVVTPNVQLYFSRVINLFYRNPLLDLTGFEDGSFIAEGVAAGERVFVGRGAYLSPGCSIGQDTKILQNVFIGAGTAIGERCLIYPNVTIREGVKIGNGVIVHSGTVIGSDGFGYAKDGPRTVKIEQTGTVEICDDVEIGANAAIDRASLSVTRIGRGTKIDNLVHIAHNVEIGEYCFICGQVGFAGSVKVGNNVTLAGQVGVSGHIEIGDNVTAGGQAGISHSLKPDQVVSGYPARPHDRAKRIYAVMNQLPELHETVKKLRKKVFGDGEAEVEK